MFEPEGSVSFNDSSSEIEIKFRSINDCWCACGNCQDTERENAFVVGIGIVSKSKYCFS